MCISYIDVLNTSKDRQEELEKQYYFLCKCPKCIDDTELEIMTAAVCQNASCDGYVNMCNVGINDIAKCKKCDIQLDEDLISKYFEVTEINEVQIRNMNNLNCILLRKSEFWKYFIYWETFLKSVLDLDICKICLDKSKGILYKLNIQIVKLLDSSFESSIDLERWNDAKIYGTKLLEGYL